MPESRYRAESCPPPPRLERSIRRRAPARGGKPRDSRLPAEMRSVPEFVHRTGKYQCCNAVLDLDATASLFHCSMTSVSNNGTAQQNQLAAVARSCGVPNSHVRSARVKTRKVMNANVTT